ncbi:hypothetical protein ACE1ET_13480 [Saccharicrinis sp. FJH62]|uniref:hypothetical protein n=1 Tax=Saccharicrinis sp. FJH62 TaxID=3344657 RepID=UPI0035D4356D
MKKILFKFISIILAFLLINIQVLGSNIISVSSGSTDNVDEIINFDEDLIYSQFDEINDLTNQINSQGASTETAHNSLLLKNISLEASLPLPEDDVDTTEPPLGIPSFLWGCVFGVVGIIIVYIFTDENKVELKKALNGCVVGYVVPTVVYILVYAVFVVAATSGSTSGNLQYY